MFKEKQAFTLNLIHIPRPDFVGEKTYLDARTTSLFRFCVIIWGINAADEIFQIS